MSAVSPIVTLAAREMELEALRTLERAKQRELSTRWQLVPVCKLAAEARRLNAEAVIVHDPDMPNGIRIELRPLDVPAWLRSDS